MIHKVTGLCNEGSNPVNEKNVKKLVETNLKTKSDGRNMRIDLIAETDVRVLSKIIGYKMNHSSRLNFVPAQFIHAAYLMTAKREKSECVKFKEIPILFLRKCWIICR